MLSIPEEIKALRKLRGEMQRNFGKLDKFIALLSQKEKEGGISYAYPLPDRSAFRRSSLDLTRALAEWRKAR